MIFQIGTKHDLKFPAKPLDFLYIQMKMDIIPIMLSIVYFIKNIESNDYGRVSSFSHEI